MQREAGIARRWRVVCHIAHRCSPQPRRRHGRRRPEIADKVAQALAAAGLDAEDRADRGGDCAVRCRAVAERGDELLVVGGGDGTISAAASALVGTETGSASCRSERSTISRAISAIPTDLGEAAKLIAGRNERRVDVAEMNGRIFINNSAIGLYPLMVARPRPAAQAARAKQAAGDDRRLGSAPSPASTTSG